MYGGGGSSLFSDCACLFARECRASPSSTLALGSVGTATSGTASGSASAAYGCSTRRATRNSTASILKPEFYL
ncbi:hypothetical protein Y032_0139g2127 [Ancylostoma ceylanicum]|uniref:Uncharacterized protein n=1 Tax=Ancylostoma ceylanicum TaxID=53326 RepID=A0A016T4M1_9BILA|nr:hypothetical protein Y032_0139g2127 [Ancylostoma ceylanicum]